MRSVMGGAVDTVAWKGESRLRRTGGPIGQALAIAALVLMASCGGQDSPAPERASEARARATKLSTLGGTEIPADAHVNGMWGTVADWPLIPLHAVLLTDGRVLTFGTDGSGKQTGYFIFDVWDPAAGLDAGSHLTLPNSSSVDTFCSSPLLLPTGDGVAISGGDNWTGTATTNTGNPNSILFNPADNTLSGSGTMSRPRWYATSTALLNGEILVMGGLGGEDRADIRTFDGSYRQLGVDTSFANWNYPRNFVAPNGKVFGFDVAGQMYYLDPAEQGSITLAGAFTETRDVDSTALMFRPGRILQFGGSSDLALVIDINGATPIVAQTQRLSSQRRWVNSTVLPDGNVLATGGSRVANELIDVSTSAEIWDPSAGTWHVGASAAVARLYHSTALLLPDATVLVAGGGAPGPLKNLNAEIYYPPYLFNADSTLATRPAITAVPAVIDIGQTIAVDVDSARPIHRATLIKTGSVTHSFNFEQRFLELPFASNGNHLSVQIPPVAAQAPPGTYMLFVLDDAGVPSQARMLRMNVAGASDPAITPTMTQPTGQSSMAGQIVSLSIAANDPNGDPLTYSATELPPGLAIDPTTGVVSGVPTEGGTFVVTVYVTDGINATSRTFTWVISGSTAPLSVGLSPDAPEPKSLAGALAYFSAAGQGNGVEYSWNFGDESAPTDWSPEGHASHTFALPGAYLVTVTVRDAAQRTARHSFIQAVQLPPLAGTPSASSSMAVEPLSMGSYRIWMVNQDNDSVSVFDGASRARLAEIAVGKAPRSVAIAANGRVWVTNKVSGTISVIDPKALAIVALIPMGNGSRPHGIIMSPDRQKAYVALEGSGKVAVLNTNSTAILTSTSVGPNPRHVSINAAGTELLVSRYVTPPQPGESTAIISSGVNGVKTGGEVVVLNASNLSTIKTVVLEHSDRTDSPFSGRGVPNYLGAAAISPDGVQAWVPSKQDNILRGLQRDGRALDFQTTVRAIASKIDLSTRVEATQARVDLNNSAVASAAIYDPSGVFLFVTLETSREVAIIDAHRHYELLRVDAGRAPQGLALSPDGRTLFVENYMDRSLGAYDLTPLLTQGRQQILPLPASGAVVTEKLAANLLLGKQYFYDARDRRLARDGYMSCAACHNDGGSDGRVWDLTQLGEGLRRTIGFRGKGKDSGHGFRHWSGNFDEVQDFESQIRSLAGGTGLMSDAAYNAGTTAQPLGAAKAGLSADLDALAAYVNSLNVYDPSPYYSATPSAAVTAGKTAFRDLNCQACHAGTAFSSSGNATLLDIGTIKPTSGGRLGGALLGIDPPTLRGAWSQTALLHDGSAPTLDAAIQAHKNVSVTGATLSNLVAYLQTIGSEEPTAPAGLGTGTGLTGDYFGNMTVSGAPVVSRVEAVDFTWGSASPAPGLAVDGWSVRWSGMIEFPATGTYRLQLQADDGARLTVNGQAIVNVWSGGSGTVSYLSGPVNANAGDRVPIVIDHYDKNGDSTVKLRWTTPGATIYYLPVPADRLYPVIDLTPTVSLVAPSTASVGTVVNLSGTASDVDGTVSRVDFYDGAMLIGSATSPPYTAAWLPASTGTHSLTARVTDNGGGAATSAPALVQVSPANLPPTAMLLAPDSGTVGVEIVLQAAVGDADGTVALIEFFSDGMLIASSSTGLTSAYWTPGASGKYALTVRVTDNAGAATTSDIVYVSVSPPPNQSPAVTLTAPDSAVVDTPVNLSAAASDPDGQVMKVEFFDGTTLIATVTSAPYTTTWIPASSGSRLLTARVTDDAGATTTSAPVAVSVAAANVAPTAMLLAPSSGVVGTQLTLEAVVGDSDGTVVLVEFFDGGTMIGSSAVGVHTIFWAPATPGVHSLTVRATDNLGLATTSASVNVDVHAPNVPPSVALSAPGSGSSGVAMDLSATASDSDGTIAKVEFYDGGFLIGTSTASPYMVQWASTVQGTHQLTAKATDDAGAATTSNMVAVVVGPPPNVPPVVTLLAPGSGSSGVAMELSAAASDPDGAVVKVEFYDGTTLIGSSTASPYTVSWATTVEGSHSITAQATDSSGAVATSNVSIVTVGPPPNVPPSVTMSEPSSGTATVAMNLSATASDSDGTVAMVEFFAGTTLIGTRTVAPYTVSWTPPVAGTYLLSARATDNGGGTTTSNAVNVSVGVAPVPGGLVGTYFADANLEGSSVLTRVEPVYFNWAPPDPVSPGPGIPSDNWSVRWVGYLRPPESGNYQLQIIADDGLRVWLDGVKVVDSWKKGGNVTYTLPSLTNTVGRTYTLMIEHFDGTGNSSAKLRWKTPIWPNYWDPVPATALYSTP